LFLIGVAGDIESRANGFVEYLSNEGIGSVELFCLCASRDDADMLLTTCMRVNTGEFYALKSAAKEKRAGGSCKSLGN
jgi:hypothetical protein